jgi:membrane protein DedA with SNARE-associated domain
VFGTILGVLGIFIGFLFWAVQNLERYILTWSIVFCISLVIMLILVYFGGKDRRRQEKELIA